MAFRILNSNAITTPQAVANFFLKRATADRCVLTQLQLLKLVYIAHGWTLATLGSPLVDEPVEAWKYGPVIPSIYHEFKHFGSMPISQPSVDLHIDGKVSIPEIPDDKRVHQVLEKVWSVYSGLSGPALMRLTHQDGTPWSQFYDPNTMGKVIPDAVIAQHYRDLIAKGVSGARK